METPHRPSAVHEPERFTLRDETDLVAVVVTTMGFHPTDSVVMVCLDTGGRVFTARCDLARQTDHLDDVVASMVQPLGRNPGRTVLLATFTDDVRSSRRHLKALTRALEQEGCRVVMSIRVHEGRWFPAAGNSVSARAGVPFDLGSHQLMARMVLRGEVLLPDRDALERTIDPTQGAEADAVAEAWAALEPFDLLAPDVRTTLLGEAQWLEQALLDDPGAWPPATLARVLRAVGPGAVRDTALVAVAPDDAESWVRVWRRAVQLAPAEAVAGAAALLAFAAWAAGDGALAWCGVERAREQDPEHSLAGLVAGLLEEAVPPSTLVRMREGDPHSTILGGRPRSA